MIAEYLNESLSSLSNIDVEPIVKAHYTPDFNGMMTILREGMEDSLRLESAFMKIELLAEGMSLSGAEGVTKSIALQEGAVTDFFEKVKKWLMDLWAKIKGFFTNMWKSVYTRVGDIEKVIAKYKDQMNKDYTDFEYEGYEWSGSTESEAKNIESEATALLNQIKTSIQTAKETAESSKKYTEGQGGADNTLNADADSIERQKEMAGRTKQVSTSAFVNSIYTKSAKYSSLTSGDADTKEISEYKREISEKIRGAASPKKIKNFATTSIDNMCAFVKAFKSNKVLKDLQTATDKIFKEAISAADTSKKTAEDCQKVTNSGKQQFHVMKTAVSQIQTHSANMKNVVSAYDSMMAVLIELEKEKFNEYCKVIGAAIRYSPKK